MISIFETCSTPDVAVLVGLNPMRFYPFGEAPQNVTLPYAVWQAVGGSPENYLGDLPDMDMTVLQIDVYAVSAASARAVAEALRDAIEPRAHIISWLREGRDSETRAYRCSFDVDWFQARPYSS